MKISYLEDKNSIQSFQRDHNNELHSLSFEEPACIAIVESKDKNKYNKFYSIWNHGILIAEFFELEFYYSYDNEKIKEHDYKIPKRYGRYINQTLLLKRTLNNFSNESIAQGW